MKKATEKKGMMSSTGAKVAVGVGATLAAAAGAYFLYGTKQGKKTRHAIKGWALKAKGEVLEKMEQLKDVSEETYNKVIDTVMKKYGAMKNIDSADVMAVATELRKHWVSIKKHVVGATKPKAKKAASKKRI